MDLDPTQRDIIIRTIIGEAADQPDIGKAAVAHVVLNRLNAGNYGKTPTEVVLAPKQFEPWESRAGALATIPRTSKIYQSVGDIVDSVSSGNIPDPTSGATHFANVKTVQDRGNNKAMSWINNMQNVTRIGDHTFGNADGPPKAMGFNAENAPHDFLGAFIRQKSGGTQGQTQQEKSDTSDYLSDFIKAKDQSTTPPATNLPPEGYYDGRLHINVAPQVPMSGEDAKGNTIWAQSPVANPNPKSSIIPQAAQDYLGRLNELAGQNASMIGEGGEDIAKNRTVTGVGKVGLGALGYLTSPLGAIDKPIEKATGNKEFGEKAALLLPSSSAGKIANAYRPTVMAVRDIIKDIGQENLPSVIRRLESNPNLTLMDVAPAVRGNAAGLATDPRNVPAMTHLNEFQKQRMAGKQGDAINIFEDALGKTPDMAKTVEGIKQTSVDVGKKMIEPALESSAPVPVKSLTSSLDRMINSPEAIAGETPRIPLDPTQIRLLQLRKQITSGEAAPLNERVKFSIDPINDAIKTGGMSEARLGDFTEARRLLNSARRGHTSEEDLLSGLKTLAKKQKIVGPIDDAVNMITKGPTEYRSADFVHGLQSRLREEAGNLSKSATGSDRNMAHSLHDARDKLVEHIDRATTKESNISVLNKDGKWVVTEKGHPIDFNQAKDAAEEYAKSKGWTGNQIAGTYRPALKQYAESKAIDEAFKEGFNIFSNPTSAEGMIANHPAMWRKWMEGASEAEKRAVAQGVLFGANNRIMNTRRGIDIPENSFAHERIASVVGKKNADEIVRRLNDWRDISETDNLLTKNSATALRQAGQQARSVREPKTSHDILQSIMPGAVVGGATHLVSGGNPILTALAGGTVIGAGKAANMIGKARDISANKAYAQWASAMGTKKSDLIEMLREASRKGDPTSSSQKLMNLAPPALLQALPR